MKKEDYINLREEMFSLMTERDALLEAIGDMGKGNVTLSISIKPEGGKAKEIECCRKTANDMVHKFIQPQIDKLSERITEIETALADHKKKPIPLWTECEKEREEFRLNGISAIENCVFCEKPTRTWHIETNNPICVKCGEVHYVSEIPEDYGEMNRKKLKDGTFDYGTSVRAN